MSKVFTLTVPDVLWINLQLTGAPQAFNYATLEEATFYQFSSGASRDIARQAARFILGFRRLDPFSSGNEGTAFIGCVAFIRMNGHGLRLSDSEAKAWQSSLGNLESTTAFLQERMTLSDTHGHEGEVPNSEAILAAVIDEYPETILALANSESVPA